MEYQGGFETFKEATKYMFESPSLWDILSVVLGFFLAVGLLILFPYALSRYKAKIRLRREFFSVGKSLGLFEFEIALLWRCAKLSKEPTKVLQSKVVFEKCINKLVKEDLSIVEMLSQIRKKLKFDSIPWFLPLSSTRDIELYQTGFLFFENVSYSSALWDKDELELHIALLDTPTKAPSPGERVKFSFLREDDGRYYFQGEIKRVYRDGNRLIVVVPHTDQLSKIQLREYLRWKVNIPAKVFLYENTMDGVIEDISPKGVRVCLSKWVEVKPEDGVFIQFEIKGFPIEATGTVRHVRGRIERICLGVRFDSLREAEEEYIRRFILEEQREALRAYKMEEPKEGSSS
ncbi:MAG: flagellar brake protein [Aquificaceae bacterium]